MSLVVNPYSYFTDTNGNALNGYLYVGEVGKNAENYPIAIFYDALFTIPAPNPLTVSAGYIYNGGTIAQIYASVDYSIVVKKTDGSLVYSSLNETGMTNGAIANIDEMKNFVAPYDNYALNVLGYSEAGDGGGGLFYYDANSTEDDNGGTIIQATGVTTGRWIRQYSGAVNVKWFGAKGDGVTDDTAAFNNTVAISSSIFIPSGTFIIENVYLYKKNISGNGIGETIVKAKSGASTVFYLRNNGDWDFSILENLKIDGNNKTSNGVTFGDRTDGMDGRWTIRDVNFVECDKAIYKPRGNIGNTYSRLKVDSCNFGFYAIGQLSPIMHAGCDIFDACHFGGGITTASWYINNNNVDGYGQTVVRNCISEGNAGATFVIKNTGYPYNGIVIDNLWTEANNQNTSITIEGTTYLTADYILDNAQSIQIKNSFLKSYRAKNNSSLIVDNSRIDNNVGYFIGDKDSSSIVTASNCAARYRGVGVDILFRDIKSSLYKNSSSNARNPYYYCKRNTSVIKNHDNKVVSKSFAGTSPWMIYGNWTIWSTQVNKGNIYTEAALFSTGAGGQHSLGGFNIVVGKWYVMSMDIMTTGTAEILGDANAGVIDQFSSPDVFRNIKSIFYCSEARTISTFFVGGSSGGTLTIREYQAVSFDTEAEALSYLNSTAYTE